MSLQVNVLMFGPINTQIIWIILVIEICLNKTCVFGITPCQNDLQDNYMVQDVDKSVQVTMCFTDFYKNNTKVLIKHKKTEYSGSDGKVTFDWKKGNRSRYNLHIYIFNITDADLTLWTLILYDTDNRIDSYEKTFKLFTDMPNQFYESIQHENNEPEVSIVCSAFNFPKKIEIFDRCEDIKIDEKTFNPKNYKKTIELRRYMKFVKSMQSSQVALECRIFDFQNEIASKFLDIKKENEPAFICPQKDKEIKANVYDTVSISFKLLAYPGIKSVIVRNSATNNTSLEIKNDSWKVESRNLSEVLWSLELTKNNIKEEDFGNYTVIVTSNADIPVNESFVLSLKDPPQERDTVSCDISTNDNLTVFYTVVKSGLPLTLPSLKSKPYSIDIVLNLMASEYLIKVSLQNYSQYIEKPQNITLLAGARKMSFSFKFNQKHHSLTLCVSTNPDKTLLTRIGENVTYTMCVISESLLDKNNVGFNKYSIATLNSLKYSVEINQEDNKNYITLIIRNITRDDIKFYTLRVRDNLKRTATLILNLNLNEEIPYICNNTKPTAKVVSEKTLDIRFCIRSYPVLTRDIFANNILYTFNTTTNAVIVESRVDEETFSNYVTLKIPVNDSLKTVNISVKSIKNKIFSFALNVGDNVGIGTTLTTLRSSTTIITNITTPEHEESQNIATTTQPYETTSCTNIIIISVLAAVITISLIVLLIYFIYFRRKLVKRKSSPTLRLKYLNQPHYNNMEELKSLKVDKDQNLSNYETRYANIVKERNVDQVMQSGSRSTELAPGRHRNDEGLIYITIDHSDLQSRSSKSYISKASQPETESNYVTIDPFKTKHFK